MSRKPAVKKSANKSRRAVVQKVNVPKANVAKTPEKKPSTRPMTVEKFSTSHELAHMLATGQVFNRSVDWACFAALGKLALDIRSVVTAEAPFVKVSTSAATSGRLISLILYRMTVLQRSMSIKDIAKFINAKHSTVTGWVNWLEKQKLIERDRKHEHYHAADFDFSLMRRALATVKVDLVQALAAVEALEHEIDREKRNQSVVETEIKTETKSETKTKTETETKIK
jgi:predicted transcriptional regulator